MGWIFGTLGSRPATVEPPAPGASHASPRHVVRSPDGALRLAAGGVEETCRAGRFPEGGPWTGWVVAGLGLEAHDDGLRRLDDAGWTARLGADAPDVRSLGGHFVALRYGPGRVEVVTDAFGVRTLHVARAGGGVVFGTALAEVAAAAGARSLDVGALGPHWGAFNAFTSRSLVEGVRRLGPGARALLTPEAVEVDERNWLPEPGPPRPEALAPAVARALRGRFGERTISLGLSGGLDSRFLLALSEDAPIRLHTFGPPDDPDVRVARRVAEAAGRPLRHVPVEVPGADELWRDLHAYAGTVCATTPASALARLAHFERLHADGLAVVDGGLGEVARRQFLNRLRRSRLPLRADAALDLLPFLAVTRAEVFAPEAREAMRAGAVEELAAALDALPALPREDALDLFAVRTRLPYFFGYEQARLDAQAVAYMPFAQPEVLEAVFATPRRLRRDGRLVRRVIRRAAPPLARIPLVKGSGTYPFRLGTAGAHVYTLAAKRLAPPREDPVRARVLAVLEGRVRALAASGGVRSCPLYDPGRVRTLVDAYYGGDAGRGAAVDWWLAFEAWRRTITGEAW